MLLCELHGQPLGCLTSFFFQNLGWFFFTDFRFKIIDILFGDADPLLEHRDGDDDDDEVRPQVVPPAVCCRTGLPLCFLVIGVHTSQISISLSLLMISERSLMSIASLTLLVYQSDSRSINFTSFQVVGARRNGGGLGTG